MTELEDCLQGGLENYTRLQPLLKVDKVSKSFGSNLVLDEVSFSVNDIIGKPQIITILGQSGSGKTVLLRLIAGLDTPTSGEVSVSNLSRDTSIFSPVKAGDIGVVFQKYPLFDNLNVYQNLITPAIKTGHDKQTAHEKAEAYLKAFGLLDAHDKYPVELSGGMRQRISLLQQLMVKDRRFIVLDEPFSNLDVVNVRKAIEMIRSVAHLHTQNTFIIVTHDITNALILSDTLYVLGRKNKAEDGSMIGGSSIVHEYDLIKEGLAYKENIEDLPRFISLRKELKYSIIPSI